jgi:hypothetical protein
MKVFKVAILALLSVQMFAQKTTISAGTTFYVSEGTTVKFEAVDAQGNLKVRAKTAETDLTIEGEITGDEKLNLVGPLANVKLNNCSWNVSNEATDTVNDLTLNNNARVVLEPGFGLQTDGDVLDQSTLDPSVRIKADASSYGQLHLAGTYVKSGSGPAAKETFFSPNETWRQLGATLQGASGLSLSQWSDDISLYFSNDDPELQNVFLWDGSPAGKTNPYQLDATGWVSAAANQTINATQAGAIYMGPSSILYRVNSNPVTESGDIQTGDVSYNLFYTEDDEEDKELNNIPHDYGFIGGWNLIHNSYTANISLAKLFDYGGANAWPLAYPYVHVWDPDLGQYRALTNGGALASIIEYNNNSSNAVTAVDATIAPGQAFWVKTIDAAGLDENGVDSLVHEVSPALTTPLILSRDYLDIGGVPQNFFKTAPTHIRIGTIAVSDSVNDQTVLLFDNEAQLAGDALDAFKLESLDNTRPSLFSKAEHGALYCINALPNNEEEYHIPVSFISNKHFENYFFRLDEIEIDPAWIVQVEDKILGQMHDMSGGGEFTFSNEKAFRKDRFVVHINTIGKRLTENYKRTFTRTMTMYGNSLSINQNATALYSLSVYSISGRLLKSVDQLKERNEVLDLSALDERLIVIAITDAKGTTSEKFILSHQ